MPAKIAIAVPSHDNAPIGFAGDLAAMAMYSRGALDPSIEIGICMIGGTYVHSARRKILRMCMDQKCTHILWLDSDMRFPQDALVRLLNHDKPMVGINYANRMFPTGFVAFSKLDDEVSERLETLPESTGLVEVDALGFGCLLMSQEVFKILPPIEEDPWFTYDWKAGIEVGEDVHFCKMVQKRGITIYVDQDLSNQCGHIGQMIYTLQMVPISQKVIADEQAEKHRMSSVA